ncbi:hypothetical protein [Luethyella okanaganae]|uniref:HTH HARE-type domain-containing protein n=1 Tax=Luethyella okanaganae TaxID=69372 RepID=A0ABW1VJB0_9MICO
MDINPLRTTLKALRTESSSVESRVADLENELSDANARLSDLQGAIVHLERLLGDSSSAAGSVNEPLFTPETDTVNNDEAEKQTSPLRVPSAEWVKEVVETIGRPATKNEIFEAFGNIKGFPETWKNRRNSFNNALNRAADRDLIQRLDGDRFAPRYFAGAADSLDPGGR